MLVSVVGRIEPRRNKMADSPDEKIKAFNTKVASLIKEASPDDLVHILKNEKSLVAAGNQNQNQGKAPIA